MLYNAIYHATFVEIISHFSQLQHQF